MKNFILGILLLSLGCVNAQSQEELFDLGNKQYQQEKYIEAIKSYESIIDKGFESSALYFNIGNAYYRTNQIGEAIYFYEKALLLDPTNEDVKVNLAYANRSIIDTIKAIPKSTLAKFNDNVLAVFSYNTWAKMAVGCSLLAGFVWLLFFFNTLPGVKKLYFTLGLVISIFCLLSISITAQQYNRTQNRAFAIVFSDSVEVKNAPRDNASEAFVLHEGTKVQVMDTVGDWQKIKISDGQVGWLLESSIQKI